MRSYYMPIAIASQMNATIQHTLLVLLVAQATVFGSVVAAFSSCHQSNAMATQQRNNWWGKLEQVQPQVHRLFMENDGVFPNNSNHPLLLFRGACEYEQQQGRKLLIECGWTSPWVWGVFTYHHYHSNAWEVLICIKGSAEIQLGGPTGPVVTVDKGDVILIPPGFVHKQLSDRDGFALLGSYPNETPHADTIRGAPSEEQMRNIQECFVPAQEPVTNIKLSDLYE